jgi:hypothetical protein
LVLVPALAAASGSGLALAKGRRVGLVNTKLKRMPFIAANGLPVLVPSALFLAFKARSGQFDLTFYLAQAIELAAGATNLTLLGLNMRDGLKINGRRRLLSDGRKRLPSRSRASTCSRSGTRSRAEAT